MAKTATAKKAKTVPGRNVATVKKTTATTSSTADELAELVAVNRELESNERLKTGNKNSFITLVKANSGIIDPHNPAFIKGVKPLDYAISSKKLGLGKSLDATITGMFKLYAEVEKPKGSDLAKTITFWMPEQAQQFDEYNGPFDRILPNGHILQPCHWVFLYLHDHPEIEDGLISFRGKGTGVVYTPLEKLIKAESNLVTELRFKITSQPVSNDKYKKTDYYPKFEIVGRNYKIDENGKVLKSKDSDLDADTLKEILSRSRKVMEDYTKSKLVGRKDLTQLLGPANRPALPAGKGGYVEDDDEGDAESYVNF